MFFISLIIIFIVVELAPFHFLPGKQPHYGNKIYRTNYLSLPPHFWAFSTQLIDATDEAIPSFTSVTKIVGTADRLSTVTRRLP